MNNPSERSEISLHELKIVNALREYDLSWFTNKEISVASGVNERTTRLHTYRLVKLGMLDCAEVFPAHRYRWSAKAASRNKAYTQRLAQASEVFGLEKSHGSFVSAS